MSEEKVVIRVGDKFTDGRNIWKIIRTMPGGKLDLFCEASCRFVMKYHRDVRTWDRV
jgi:hypothetical protein